MAQKYSDYYTDETKIKTMVREGNWQEREIALGSLAVHFHNQKSRYEEFFELCWNIFLSDESPHVRKSAFSCACKFATEKRLWIIAKDILQNEYNPRKLNLERIILQKLVQIRWNKKTTK